MKAQRGSVVCVDFQMDQLFAIEVANGSVSSWTTHHLPRGLFRRGDPVDSLAVGTLLRRTLDASNIKATRALFTVADDAVVTRLVSLPKVRGRDIPRIASFLAEKELRIPLHQASWSFDVLPAPAGTTDLLLVATWSDLIGRMREIAEVADLRLEVVEPRSLALSRALQRTSAIVLETAGSRVLVTVLLPKAPPLVAEYEIGDQTQMGAELVELIRRAERRCEELMGPGHQAVLLVGGDLDGRSALPESALRASLTLNGHRPLRPEHMPAGHYLAPLGLAMRGLA